MHEQFPDLVTLTLKRNLKLGTRMEVHTLLCTVYHHMILKDERAFTLTRLSRKGGLENQPQWEHFKELVGNMHLVTYSFWQFEEFWPSDLLQAFHKSNRKRIIELANIVSLFFPGQAFRSSMEVDEFLSAFISADDSYPDDPTFRLFNDLSNYVSALDLKSHQDIATLLSLSSPAVAEWLDKLRYVTTRRSVVPFRLPDNVRKGDTDESPETLDLSDKSIASIFSVEGTAGKTMPGFERRPEQVKFAKRYLRTLKNDQYFLAEAGTGTGKSLAYLVPSLLYNADHGASVVISTHTRNLQHQLFYKDLVQAEKMVGREFSSLILKGRGNYLCLLKMHIARGTAARKYGSEQLADLASVLIWKDLTVSGDLSELGGLSPEMRKDVACEAAFCPRSNCAHYRSCFLFRARRAALKSDVTVTNHALFFSDILSEADILGKPEVVIFDEAHQVERVATDSLTGELSRSTLSSIFEPIESTDPGMPDRLSNVAGIIARNAEDESAKNTAVEINAACSRLVTECQRSVNVLFTEVGRFVEKYKMVPSGYSRRERFGSGHRFLDLVIPLLSDLHSKLRSLEKKLTWLVERLDPSVLEAEEVMEAESIQSVIGSIREYAVHIENIREVADERWVRWIEVSSSGWCSIKVAPVEIGEMLKELVYEKYRRVLFTSATMTVERDFTFIEERLGLDRLPKESREKSIFGSSFDYSAQVRFVCTAYLPSPRTDYYPKKLSGFLRSVFRTVDKSMLVLFTSYQSIRQTVTDLGGQFPKLLAQEGSDSVEKMLHDFKQLKPAILFGTESFWHGVDLPGDQLEVLVITRLPFSVPGDPIDTARMELVEKRGDNSFACYSLPAAVLRFKQGFGRLIRTGTDQGVIIVTDNRLVRSNFGQSFLNSVPSEVEIATCWEEVHKALEFGQ